MSDILSEEQQQLETIKNWIREHFLSLLAAVAIFCAIVFGSDMYQSYKNGQIWPVSDTYNQFNTAVSQASSGTVATDAELQLVDQLADLLAEQHGDSYYAFLASLTAAKLSVDLGNFDAAKSRLHWAESHTSGEADEMLVNYRLALLDAQLGEFDAALERLQGANSQFAALYAEVRGDIYANNSSRDEAVAAYQEALDTVLDVNSTQRRGIEMKLNNLLTGLGALQQ